jgi:hypothetical protein
MMSGMGGVMGNMMGGMGGGMGNMMGGLQGGGKAQGQHALGLQAVLLQSGIVPSVIRYSAAVSHFQEEGAWLEVCRIRLALGRALHATTCL